jgi:hypothetical protein
MRIFNFILALAFLVLAFMQVDAPQPFVWILIYGSMSVVCIMATFEYYHVKLMIVQVFAFVVYGIILIPSVAKWFAQDDVSVMFNDVLKPTFITETYRFIGLVICLSVLVFYFFRSGQKKTA